MSDSKVEHKSVLDDVWDGAVGGFDWLKSVLFGEFADHRSLSAMIADMLISFVPGVVIVTSARDAVAVIIRLAQHPEKREEAMEWIMLAACMIVIALPLAMAAGGAIAAGVGGIVGGIAGSELGAALRAVMLLLIKEATKLGDVIKFLQKFVRGDLMFFLRSIKFAKYEKALVLAFEKTISKLIHICEGMRGKLEHLKYFDDVKLAIKKLTEWESKFYAVQQAAVKQLPRAVAELDLRLSKLVAQVAPKETHAAVTAVKAEKPAGQALNLQYIHDSIGKPLHEIHAPKADVPKAPPKPKSEAAPKEIKKQPDPVEKVEEGPNTKRQETADVGEVVAAPLLTNPKDIRAASGTWSAEKKARFDTADRYYSDAGYADYDSHLRGIDFDKPVDVAEVGKGEKLYQYSYPDRVTGEPKVGSYYYDNPGVDVNKLGFDVAGRNMIEVPLNEPTSLLRSTAANIEDWNGSGKIFAGGETQLFNPNVSYLPVTVIK